MDYNNLKIPNHVGIIVDGNGRWAQNKGMGRSEGHKAGSKNLINLSKYIFSKGIKILSVYVFSTENFKRSQKEVDYLMNLFILTFKKDFNKFKKDNVKIVFSGRREPLPEKVLDVMDKVTKETANNTGSILNMCINYGGHAEIVDAAKKINSAIMRNEMSIDDLNEENFNKYLYNDLPPVDFLIRTSGEMRISNFMLWQISYAEFYFPNINFPDFNNQEFDKAIIEYTSRDRRFGGINYENKSH
jgi:undecaprenyl diphosphate synthase